MLTIFDVGARYGLHPCFKAIEPLSDSYLFEPEPVEFERLSKYYEGKKNIKVEKLGLTSSILSSRQTLNVYNHGGLSSVYTRENQTETHLPNSSTELSTRYEIDTTTAAQFCQSRGIVADFAKIDVEGAELDVLEGFGHYLDSLVGLRLEVNFASTFKDSRCQFSEIQSYLDAQGFKFLNFDFSSGQIFKTEFVDPGKNLSVAEFGDALWINQRISESINKDNLKKTCIFLYINNFPGEAILFIQKIGKNSFQYNEDSIDRLIVNLTAKHLHSIRWQPGLSYEHIKLKFNDLFGLEFPDEDLFYWSTYWGRSES